MFTYSIVMWVLSIFISSIIILHANEYKSKSWFGNNKGFDDEYYGMLIIAVIFAPIVMPIVLTVSTVFYLTRVIYTKLIKRFLSPPL